MDENAKYGEAIGIDEIYCAIVTKNDVDGYGASAPFYLAPAAEVAAEAEKTTNTRYYDNKAMFTSVTEGLTKALIKISGINDEKRALLEGKPYDALSGRVLDDAQPNPPVVAFGFRTNIGKKGEYRYYWYLAGTFNFPKEEAATANSDIDVKQTECEFTAVNTEYKFTYPDASVKSCKRVYGQTTTAAFDATGWFDQVQTPSTAGAPSALSVVADPLDGAIAVAVNKVITLTFNNAIEDYSGVTLIKASNNSAVAVAMSLNNTGKILSITPNANLAAATTFILSVAGVKDIFGQVLATSIIDFTTV